MNVSCPQCATVFRVDPAKVPERGARARCSVCGALIPVRRPAVAPPAIPVNLPTPPMPSTRIETPPPVLPPVVSAPPMTPPPATPAPRAEPVVEPPAPAPFEATAPLPPPAVSFDVLPPSGPLAPSAPASPQGPRFSNPFLQQDPTTRARRLARALISDLVVYHPEKRARGLADGSLKELFGEEIRKSWEEYVEQVGEDLAKTTPYFTEALNEILAEGRLLFC